MILTEDRIMAEEENEHDFNNRTLFRINSQSIVAIVAVLGLLISFFWTIADFKVSITDLNARISNISLRIDELSKRIYDIDISGSRKVLETDSHVKRLEENLNDIRNTVKSTNEELKHHNELMEEFYKKRR